MEFISISQIIKKSPGQYALAFLYPETDESDVTYFVLNQLGFIVKAVDAMHEYITKQTKEINEVEQLFNKKALRNKLNYRKIAVIKHALKHPTARYQIEEHRQHHHVTYDTARTDLLKLAKLGLLLNKKIGKAFIFIVPADLKKRIGK